MLAARARDTDGYLFPLCRTTAFKLKFEESINKRHSFESCWCLRASITEHTSLQKARTFSWEKNSLNSFWRLRKEHTSLSWWRRYYPTWDFSLFCRQIQITVKSLISPGVNKWGWDEEQRVCNIGLQSKLSTSWCPCFSSESELSSLKVRFSRYCDRGNSSLGDTDFIVDGKSG